MAKKKEGAETTYNGEDYEVIPKEAVAASTIITDMWVKLGKPATPFSKSGKKLMEIIISVWRDLWPQESEDWFAMRDEYKKAELPISTQVRRKTGRSLASYPYPIYEMLRKVFPTINFGERKTAIKMVKTWPMFQMAKKV